MNEWTVILLCVCFILCSGREPFKPVPGAINFLVYFTSRYRGICVGMLVNRMVVITAAVCVVNPLSLTHDTRPITVITSSAYRHPRRGIRVQVTKILTPKRLSESLSSRAFLIEKSVALMMLRNKVPDILAEVPPRPLNIDFKGEEVLRLKDQCFTAGWHYFYKGDKIFSPHKFLLQRNLRIQFMNIVKMMDWCEALEIKMNSNLHNIGIEGSAEDNNAVICAKDSDHAAQPCHGMYGAPFICNGRAVGMMLAPDAQWTNCTGFTNIIHLFSSTFLSGFFDCIKGIIATENRADSLNLKKAIYDEDPEEYDYVNAAYSRLKSLSSSSEEL